MGWECNCAYNYRNEAGGEGAIYRREAPINPLLIANDLVNCGDYNLYRTPIIRICIIS